jgi:hypothetical protein
MTGSWLVAGEGDAHWFPARGNAISGGHGTSLDLS